MELSDLQLQDPDLVEVISYLKTGNLPEHSRRPRELLLTKSQYLLRDVVLYWVVSEKSLRAVPPKGYHEKLFKEAHAGAFGARFGETKVLSQLSRHYWWDGMRTGMSILWCKACLVCTTRCPSRPIRVPLTLILVAGPFDRVGVDIIQFPQSYDGNKYAETVDAAVESACTEPIVREKPCKKATPVPRELPVNSPWHGRL